MYGTDPTRETRTYISIQLDSLKYRGEGAWFELPMLSRKRRLFDGWEKEPPLCTKKCLQTLQDTCETDRDTEHATLKASCTPEACVNRGTKKLTDTGSFLELMLSWADSHYSAKKVLERLKFGQASDGVSLDGPVNEKFVEFHRDITEECGAEAKQHSWAVIEKREEVVMYGPYYPNYSNGEHSEDVIIEQTQQLLQSESASEDWKVYVFTTNSPCLARNTGACMLNLVQKAREWWNTYGVKTRIGYLKCWGFKGTKETLFKDINHTQVDGMDQTEDGESYVEAAGKTEISPLCGVFFAAAKPPLRCARFALSDIAQGQAWKGYFKSMHSAFESLPQEERDVCAREANAMVEAARVLLSEKESGRFEEYLEGGSALALGYTFSSQLPDAMRGPLRLTFQQCWEEMVRGQYAERLTDDFNRCTVQLFIKDIAKFTKEYLEIGRIQFSDEAPQDVQR